MSEYISFHRFIGTCVQYYAVKDGKPQGGCLYHPDSEDVRQQEIKDP